MYFDSIAYLNECLYGPRAVEPGILHEPKPKVQRAIEAVADALLTKRDKAQVKRDLAEYALREAQEKFDKAQAKYDKIAAACETVAHLDD